jgi:hypothetical protein
LTQHGASPLDEWAKTLNLPFALAQTKGKTQAKPGVRKSLIFRWNIVVEVEEVRKVKKVKPVTCELAVGYKFRGTDVERELGVGFDR